MRSACAGERNERNLYDVVYSKIYHVTRVPRVNNVLSFCFLFFFLVAKDPVDDLRSRDCSVIFPRVTLFLSELRFISSLVNCTLVIVQWYTTSALLYEAYTNSVYIEGECFELTEVLYNSRNYLKPNLSNFGFYVGIKLVRKRRSFTFPAYINIIYLFFVRFRCKF